MPVPTYDKFIEPILRCLASKPNGALARDIHDEAADVLGISEIDRQALLPSGHQPVYKNRAGWAHDRLKRAGLSSSPRRGFWKLTEKGMEFNSAHQNPLKVEDLEKIVFGFMDVRLKSSLGGNGQQTPEADVEIIAASSPDDRLSQAITELKSSVTSELLEILAGVHPSFFETIVLDLLHKMGYGASRTDLQKVGGSGDGGIDGIISLDKLGLEKVYVQAKRWQQTVGRPEIQAFYGALAGQRANKGVFITTSNYSTQAVEFAKSVERIVLVDGVRLAELMIENEIGVSSRTIRVPKIDSDYFDEESA